MFEALQEEQTHSLFLSFSLPFTPLRSTSKVRTLSLRSLNSVSIDIASGVEVEGLMVRKGAEHRKTSNVSDYLLD